jgi:hypothetical protein
MYTGNNIATNETPEYKYSCSCSEHRVYAVFAEGVNFLGNIVDD